MLDALTRDIFDCIEEHHAATDYTRDPLEFCKAEGIDFVLGPRSLARTRRKDDDGPDLIVLNPSDYNPRDLFSIAHEIVHIILRREQYLTLIRRYHLPSLPPALQRPHVERLIDAAAGRIIMTTHQLELAMQLHGDHPQAILHLINECGASEGAALRRYAWQDTSEYRAAFTARDSYIQDATACRARLPFKARERYPELHMHGGALTLLSIGDGRTMGVAN